MTLKNDSDTDITLEVTFLVTIGKDGKANMQLKDPHGVAIAPTPVSFPTELVSVQAFSSGSYIWVCHQADHTWHLLGDDGLGGWVDYGHIGNYKC